MCCAEFLDLLSNCLCYMRIFYFSSWQVNRAFSPNQVLAYKHTTFLSPEVALKNKIKHNFYCNKTSNLPSLSASDSWDRFQPPSRARTGLVVKKMDWWKIKLNGYVFIVLVISSNSIVLMHYTDFYSTTDVTYFQESGNQKILCSYLDIQCINWKSYKVLHNE